MFTPYQWGVVMAKNRPLPVDVDVGATVRAYRLHRKMSQSDLGSHLGITFQQVQKYEKGTNRIGSSRLAQIAAALDTPIAAFYDGVSNPRGASPEKSPLLIMMSDHLGAEVAECWEKLAPRARAIMRDIARLLAKA